MSELHESGEDYLEAILRIQKENGICRSVDVARKLNVSKPSDLIAELQGRFPLRVELDSLNAQDFERILREPKNSLIKQYVSLLETGYLTLIFT